jgi:uncharacterized protein (DUF1330 family)
VAKLPGLLRKRAYLVPVSLKHVLILINARKAAFLFYFPPNSRKANQRESNEPISHALGTALGAAAVNGLHAQGKTTGAYAILDISEILDPSVVPQIVAKAVPATKAAGGQYLAATEKITALSGDPPKRVAIVAFDSVDQAKAWYNSPAQQEVNAMDDKAVKHRWYIVDSAM